MRKCFIVAVLFLALGCQGEKPPVQVSVTPLPSWTPIDRITSSSLRGIHAVGDDVAWASGSSGTVLRFANAVWRDVSIPQGKELDFRDIHAFNDDEAVVLSAGNGVYIYRTSDGGANWKLTYSNPDSSTFYDGMDFNDEGYGVAFGDPINGRMALLESEDYGMTWTPLDEALRPRLMSGEAGFAASGTGIHVGNDAVWVATGGGPTTRLFKFSPKLKSFEVFETPIESGEGTGIFSLCMLNDSELVVVGGNYVDSTDTHSVAAISASGGHSWKPVNAPPAGYRSCVTKHPELYTLISVGRTGSDVSYDLGQHWKPIGTDGYFACSLTKEGGWAVGRNGKMAKLTWP